MTNLEFREYLSKFEMVLVNGGGNLYPGCVKPVHVCQSRLAGKRIGRLLGPTIETLDVVVIDYYGYMKKSLGFESMVKEVLRSHQGEQIRFMDARVIHFSSLKLENLAKMAQELVVDFGDFKKIILDARGIITATGAKNA